MNKEIEETRERKAKIAAFKQEVDELGDAMKAKGYTFAFCAYDPEIQYTAKRWYGSAHQLAADMGELVKSVMGTFIAAALEKRVPINPPEDTWRN